MSLFDRLDILCELSILICMGGRGDSGNSQAQIKLEKYWKSKQNCAEKYPGEREPDLEFVDIIISLNCWMEGSYITTHEHRLYRKTEYDL